VFKDISPLLADRNGFRLAVDEMESRSRGRMPDVIVGIESRGFIFGAALALRLGCGFVPVRKPGKLPAETVSADYELEYGTDRVEMHKDALGPGHRALVVDDLIATGGTLVAACQLVSHLGADIAGCLVLIELQALKGRDRLATHSFESVLQF
jgi:adenine phosphoribosyltransferase